MSAPQPDTAPRKRAVPKSRHTFAPDAAVPSECKWCGRRENAHRTKGK